MNPSGQNTASRDPTLMTVSSRLRNIVDRIEDITNKVSASADLYVGSSPEPGAHRPVQEKEAPNNGLVPNVDMLSDRIQGKLEVLDAQLMRLFSNL